MAIEFSCGKCGKLLRAPEDAAGQKCRCPDCGNVATVPSAGPPPLPSVSPSKAGDPESSPAVRGKAAAAEPNWPMRIVGGMVGVAVILITVAMVSGHFSRKSKVEERERLTKLVDGRIGTAQAKADSYDFDGAMAAFDDAVQQVGDSFLSNDYIHDDLKDKIEVARNGIRPLQADYRKKIRDGWVVFEDTLIPASEHERILTERKKAAEEQERRRRAEEARRRELARLAEVRRQEEERLAAAERARADAFYMSQEFVKKQLKVPSSAKFPVFRSSDVTVAYDDETRKYTVFAWVEAQNPFGVYLRSSYICMLWPTDGNLWKSDFTNISSP